MGRRSEGRVALVTGGARGIGEATAERLAEDGAMIAIADLNGAGAEETAARIAARHGVKAIGDQGQCHDHRRGRGDGRGDRIAARLARYPGQQCRDHPRQSDPQDDRRGLGLGRRGASEGGVSVLARRAARNGQARLGPHRQSVLGLGPRQSRPDQLRRRQGRIAGHGEDPGDRTRPLRHHRQRGRAGLYRYRDDPVGRDPARARPRGMAGGDGAADPGPPPRRAARHRERHRLSVQRRGLVRLRTGDLRRRRPAG